MDYYTHIKRMDIMKKHPLMDKAESNTHSGFTGRKKADKARSKKSKRNKGSKSEPQYPHLVNDLYAVAHFDPFATDQTKFGPSHGNDPSYSHSINLSAQPIIYGGPVNIMTYATSPEDTQTYIWPVGTDRVSYIDVQNWTTDSYVNALTNADEEFEELGEDNFEGFIESADDAGETSVEAMTDILDNHFNQHIRRFGNGLYAVVSVGNILYVQYGSDINAYGVDNKNHIELRGRLEDATSVIVNNTNTTLEASELRFVGLSIAPNNQIVATLNKGVAVIDPDLILNSGADIDPAESISFVPFKVSENPLFPPSETNDYPEYEDISNSISIDPNNGVYIVSSIKRSDDLDSLGFIRKLVLDDDGNIFIDDGPDNISGARSMGAWTATYDTSLDKDPPAIKTGRGSGSTPALMGVGDDLLVVITDGAKQMKLIAYWATPTDAEIAADYTSRQAGDFPITCGFNNPESRWIQSEQSVVINENNAFVVNNIPEDYEVLTNQTDYNQNDNLQQVCLVGPSAPGPTGVQKVSWLAGTSTEYPGYDQEQKEKRTGNWSPEWERSDVASTSMVPVYSSHCNRVFVSGWENGPYGSEKAGWTLRGLDWDYGDSSESDYVLKFGPSMRGNGAYSLSQFLPDGSLILNSIIGPIKVTDT